jgi:translation initiation factor 2B subunit (eIF-2B alpha/beta/delta family)
MAGIWDDLYAGKINKDEAVEKVKSFKIKISEIDSRVITACSELFNQKISVATYSNSGMVKKILTHYRDSIKKLYVGESRPECEGRILAKEISRLGITVEISIDMLMFDLLKKADLFIIGADYVGQDYFINKTGSRALLGEAQTLGVNTAVVFESLKKTERNPDLEHIKESGKLSLMDMPYHNINTVHQDFEIIPVNLVNYLISD